ncbi:hypothetical protein ACTFO8_21820 [Bacillus cereus group sp. MYBK65-1]|uniref:hypothetical protein n=1 Tax=unclassified Bacillus cereus group TaxID=2750818 RepID=UPI002A58F43E|nr:hypothetical protein [Bacillus cereus]
MNSIKTFFTSLKNNALKFIHIQWNQLKGFPYKLIPLYIKTFFIYLYFMVNNRCIKKYPIFLFILILSLCIFPYCLKGWQNADLSFQAKNFILNFLDIIGYKGFNDTQVQTIILTMSKLLGVIFSLVITLYTFTYRELKGISPSASYKNDKNKLVLNFMMVLLFTMLYSYILSTNFATKLTITGNVSLAISNAMYPLLLIWIVLFVFSLILVANTLKSLFKTMNINLMLKATIHDAEQDIYCLITIIRKPIYKALLQDTYKRLHFNIESIYQMLKYTADNNMNNEFEANIKKLNTVFQTLKSPYNKYEIDNISTHLLHTDREEYLDITSTILRNTISLINHLYKNQHFNKGQKIIEIYFSIYSKNDEPKLKSQFIENLDDLLNSADLDNTQQIKCIIQGLTKLSDEDTLIIYKNLIMRLIVKKDIKLLTSVVYALKLHLIDRKQTVSSQQNNIILQAMYTRIKHNVVIILLQCLLKSVEISHYNNTGFLIKYIVTNFTNKEINHGLNTLIKNRHTFTSFYEERTEQKNDMPEINQETYDYCLQKLYILLYAQQQFALDQKLWFAKTDDDYESSIYLQETLYQCTYTPYIISKIYSAKDKYGLLFLKDTDFMGKIMRKIGIAEEKVKELIEG